MESSNNIAWAPRKKRPDMSSRCRWCISAATAKCKSCSEDIPSTTKQSRVRLNFSLSEKMEGLSLEEKQNNQQCYKKDMNEEEHSSDFEMKYSPEATPSVFEKTSRKEHLQCNTNSHDRQTYRRPVALNFQGMA